MSPPSVSRTVPEIRETEIFCFFSYLYLFEIQVCLWLYETSSACDAHPDQGTSRDCKQPKIGPSELGVNHELYHLI